MSLNAVSNEVVRCEIDAERTKHGWTTILAALEKTLT
jgi:hypothetical protein